MGSVVRYSEKPARYLVRWRDPERRQREKRGFTRKSDADGYLASVTTAISSGQYIDPREAKHTIGSLAEPWLRTKRSTLKPSSYAPLEASWRNYVEPRWGTVPVGLVRHSAVQEWASGIGMSSTVVKRAYGVLSGILDVAERDRKIVVNPARGVRLPAKTVQRKHRYLTTRELLALAVASGPREPLVLTLGLCGLRWGEAIELRGGDLDLVRRRIHVARAAVEVHGEIHVGDTKTGAARWVPIPALLVPMLVKLTSDKANDALVFDDGHGFHMRRTRVSAGSRSWFKTALTTAGIAPMTLHDLRHTAASIAVSSGANVKAVQRMLGHASATMTLDRYADLFDDDLEALSDRIDAAMTRASAEL
ncbi:site-specific integrase [Agrococcus baldri]|uniref:Site-specific integrase n=1 Tax=Agrococcus baldri TaxID=153730 RepID=A0AA87RJH3_9MICO|nr:site-specific integrase [Agrococcus baldri]GEK79317.1 site-specific integrase [Agrococcus baldri]